MKEGKHRVDVWQWCQEGSQTGRHPLPPSPVSPGSSSTFSTTCDAAASTWEQTNRADSVLGPENKSLHRER